jgi:hypothetical protein
LERIGVQLDQRPTTTPDEQAVVRGALVDVPGVRLTRHLGPVRDLGET